MAISEYELNVLRSMLYPLMETYVSSIEPEEHENRSGVLATMTHNMEATDNPADHFYVTTFSYFGRTYVMKARETNCEFMGVTLELPNELDNFRDGLGVTAEFICEIKRQLQLNAEEKGFPASSYLIQY